MIVTCEECTTSFQLDESRIPISGARVRCSRCKHAFFLPNPAASESEVMDSIAAEAAAEPASPAPSVAGDLAEPAAPASPTAAPTPEPEIDEEDWQFSEEIRIEGDDDFGEGLDAGGGEEESAFGVSQDFGVGYDSSALEVDVSDAEIEAAMPDGPPIAQEAATDESTSSGLELDAPPDPGPPQRDESDFGSVDDFSALMEDDETAAPSSVVADLAGEIASELDAEESELAGAGIGTNAAVGTYAEAGPTDDLGDPESWDLLRSDDYASPKSARVDTGLSAAASTGSENLDAAEFFSDDAFDDAGYDEDTRPSVFTSGPIAVAGRLVGWSVSIALVGAIVLLGLRSEWARWSEASQIVSNGPIEAETLSTGWVATSRSGVILRFEGEVRNTGSQSVWPGEIRIALLDDAGTRLTTPPIPVGLPIESMVLREATREGLEVARAEASTRLAQTPLAPGEVRRFEALLAEDRLPEAAHRALLEVAAPTRVN